MSEIIGPRLYSDDEKLASVRREIALRRNLYSSWVKKGRMKQDDADREIGVMVAIANDYFQKVKQDERHAETG
jgi:hypothetical protein